MQQYYNLTNAPSDTRNGNPLLVDASEAKAVCCQMHDEWRANFEQLGLTCVVL